MTQESSRFKSNDDVSDQSVISSKITDFQTQFYIKIAHGFGNLITT